MKDTNVGDFIVSALVTPIDGLAVSAGYVYNGENTVISTLAALNDPDAKIQGNGAVNAEIEANLGTMLDLGFDLGVGVAEKYLFSPAGMKMNSNVVLAQVYGGVDFITLKAEYGLVSILPDYEGAEAENMHMFYVGADLNVLEGLTLNVYTGATGIAEGIKYEDTFYVGGNVGYDIAGVGLNLNLQYAGEGAASLIPGLGDVGVKATGFSITPSVKVAF